MIDVIKVVQRTDEGLVSPIVPNSLKQTYATISKTGKVKPKRVPSGVAFPANDEPAARRLAQDWQPFKSGKLELWWASAEKIIPIPKDHHDAGIIHCEGITLTRPLDESKTLAVE